MSGPGFCSAIERLNAPRSAGDDPMTSEQWGEVIALLKKESGVTWAEVAIEANVDRSPASLMNIAKGRTLVSNRHGAELVRAISAVMLRRLGRPVGVHPGAYERRVSAKWYEAAMSFSD